MTDVLILGGTGWLSGRVARRWLDTGARVTCLARGERPVPDGAEMVVADREDPAAYAAVMRDWHQVVDVSSRADHVSAAVTALGDLASRWTYVSSVSAYADDTVPGADESAALHAPARRGDEYEYGAQKAAAEEAVRALGERALAVRPGLIVGDGDPSDRFGYWAAAFARADGSDVLLPPTADRLTQVIDVDDLAAYIVESTQHGAVNAVGHPHPLAEVLEEFRAAAGHTGRTVDADDEWLRSHGVGYWAGERSLPLWLPADIDGFMTRSNERYLATGGRLRPVADSIRRVLADERARGLDRPRRAGLTRAEEQELITARRSG